MFQVCNEKMDLFSTDEEANSKMIFHLNYIQESSNTAIKTVVKDMLIIALGCMSQIPTHIKGELHTHCRTQCIIMTQTR